MYHILYFTKLLFSFVCVSAGSNIKHFLNLKNTVIDNAFENSMCVPIFFAALYAKNDILYNIQLHLFFM